ncbi:threonine--tRNA ligase [Patescibacteria group bacterium]|nr:threonine--tRNA ligase [Patescibacteria group bacterium]
MSQILEEKLGRLSKEDQNLWALRHTAEHVLHTAMQNLYPKLKKAMGPATPEGFYFDFDLTSLDTEQGKKVSEADFPKIEAEMKRIIDLNLPMTQKYVSAGEARKIFEGNPYKLEWIDDIEKRGEKISLYSMGDIDQDLCSGPHVARTGEIKAYKLLSVAGAYWHGGREVYMLTRIYGAAFGSGEELAGFLNRQEEAKKRDHRKLGRELGLFVFSDLIGKGLPLLTPKGATIRRILERFIVDEEIRRGYQHVVTPPLAKTDLYRTSGHYPYYKDTMYPPMKVDEEELILRPMTCPHHFMLYKSSPRSYRDLPVRYAEISPQFRYEKSGELTGLMRVRMFTLADAHIMTPKEGARAEIIGVLDLIDFVNKKLGMQLGRDYRYRLSLGDRKDTKKYYKDDGLWDEAEGVLRSVLTERNSPFFEAPDEAAFYGPKIDVQVRNVAGHEETAFTVQYDFVMPKRFEMTFTNSHGQEEQPVVIHRSSLGAFERTMAFLIEFYGGAFPLWLAPVQVALIPIAERHARAADAVARELKRHGVRTEVDLRSEPMQGKVRDHTLQKVPYLGIIGDKEVASGTVSVRTRDGKDLKGMSVEGFLRKLNNELELETA